MTFTQKLASQPEALFKLLPSQERALEEVEAMMRLSSVVALAGRAGTGKTVVARLIAERHQADYLCLEDYMKQAGEIPYDRWDERAFRMINERFARTQILVLDDYTFVKNLDCSPRNSDYCYRALLELRDTARKQNKTLILVGRSQRLETEGHAVASDMSATNEQYDSDRTAIITLGPSFEAEDYAVAAASVLGEERSAGIEFEVVNAHAAHLTIRQIKMASALLKDEVQPDTKAFIETLGAHVLRDNMRLSEVETLEFSALPGSEHIAQALETHVVMPFEHPDMARRLGVKARRGVMLFGPPGTGKTSIGRALAHRMQGKFFLIDGSIATEPPHVFIGRVTGIIEQAVRNAPSVLFIDDADTLFTIPYVAGIVRYLLSLLDGMESASGSKVCVMMTVMDANKVPDALVRSGRVELWLETTAPDEITRARILERWAGRGLPDDTLIDFTYLAGLCEGLTPADLRRVMDDARLFYASDLTQAAPIRQATDYVAQAIHDLFDARNRMADVLRDDRMRMRPVLEGVGE